MTNTRPVLNLNAAIAIVKNGKAYLISPWNSFFQQFTQQAPVVQEAFSPYTPNQNGTVIVTGGTGITITRGSDIINLVNGQAIIPVSIGDTVSWATGTAQFLGA